MTAAAREEELAGWGHAPVGRARVLHPGRAGELVGAIAGAAARGPADGSWIARGLGRSYGDAALNEDRWVADMTWLDRFRSFDPETGELWCEAGTSLAAITDAALPRGWFLPVTPGTRHVTVGGALAADVHGKNHHADGAISAHVTGLELLTADGAIRTIGPDTEPDLFWATLGGMGLTGVILAAGLRLLPVETAWIRQTRRRAGDLEALLDLLLNRDRNHRYAVAWVDVRPSGGHGGRGVVLLGDHARREELDPAAAAAPLAPPAGRSVPVPLRPPTNLVRGAAVGLFNRIYYAANRDADGLVHLEPYFYPLDAIGDWHRFYGPAGFLQYQFVVPEPGARQAVREALAAVQGAGLGSPVSVLKRMGPEGGPLGFPIAGLTLTLDFPVTAANLALCDRLDGIVVAHGGRVYLAKDMRLKAATLRRMYPRLDEWLAIKAAVDPDGRFQSDLARRLELVP